MVLLVTERSEDIMERLLVILEEYGREREITFRGNVYKFMEINAPRGDEWRLSSKKKSALRKQRELLTENN